MYSDPELYREAVREQVRGERRKAALRARTGGRPGATAIRTRLSRFLVGAAFSIDPEAGRREFWNRAAESEAG